MAAHGRRTVALVSTHKETRRKAERRAAKIERSLERERARRDRGAHDQGQLGNELPRTPHHRARP